VIYNNLGVTKCNEASATASIERFVYDGKHIVLTFDGNENLTHRYLYGLGIDQIIADQNNSGIVLWALTDNQGTVRDVIDSSGAILNHIQQMNLLAVFIPETMLGLRTTAPTLTS